MGRAQMLGVVAILVSACDVTGPDRPAFEGPADVTLTPSGMAWLSAGAREALGGTLGPPTIGSSGSPIEYSSSNTRVATVDDAGRLRGVAVGTAIVTAKLNGQSTQYRVLVRTVRFKSIRAGGTQNVCGITTEGELLCWGGAWSIGVQTEMRRSCTKSGCSWTTELEDAPELALVPTDIEFASVWTEQQGSCGINSEGRAFCWGALAGLLRTGVRQECSAQTGRCNVGPRPLPGDLLFSRITVGYGSGMCGVTTSSQPYCWGIETFGELGGGGNTLLQTPTPIPTPQSVRSSTSPHYATCWLLADDSVWCVGDRQAFGNSTELNPGVAQGPGANGMRFAKLGGHPCGLTTEGVAYCWSLRTLPAAPAPNLRFVDIQAAITFGCGLTAGGDAYCWGYNGYGQLGNGERNTSITNPPQLVRGGLKFRTLSVGGLHVCAMTVDDVAYCWGNRPLGSDFSERVNTVPTKVPGQP